MSFLSNQQVIFPRRSNKAKHWKNWNYKTRDAAKMAGMLAPDTLASH